MGGGRRCWCGQRDVRWDLRRWRVIQRGCNHSAFNGYHRTPSDYSTVVCLDCTAVWRTKADYVSILKDADGEGGWWNYDDPTRRRATNNRS